MILGAFAILTISTILFTSCGVKTINNKPTKIIGKDIELQNQSNVFVKDYSDEMIEKYIFTNLITGNKPEGFIKDNIVLTNVKRFNG